MNIHPSAISQSDAASSLLSLSVAAANAEPLPEPSSSLGSVGVNGNLGTALVSPPLSTSVGSGTKQHRRLASTGKARRRLSDARDAANRPSPAALQSSAVLSLASLSLSSSPPLGPPLSSSLTAASNILIDAHPNGISKLSDEGMDVPVDDSVKNSSTPIPISTSKSGKKRGMDHKCESCSKIYRHPSCLIKHRWEHTPHWREASKFVLSKHQQVQLLEAAAILSHLSPSSASGTSLPDDRSLWPSFLSGGSLPKVDPAAPSQNSTSVPLTSYPVSSSVPGHISRVPSGSGGPRLHDYAIPSTNGASGITQLRPGLISVPTSNGTGTPTPSIPVPARNGTHLGVNGGPRSVTADSGYRSATSGSWGASPYENGIPTGISYASSSAGGWSHPRSSIRSVSVSSHSASRSRSVSASDEESVDADTDSGAPDEYGASRYDGRYGRGRRAWKKEEDEMEMELGAGFSVREEDEMDDINKDSLKTKEPEWYGLEMDMDMD